MVGEANLSDMKVLVKQEKVTNSKQNLLKKKKNFKKREKSAVISVKYTRELLVFPSLKTSFADKNKRMICEWKRFMKNSVRSLLQRQAGM